MPERPGARPLGGDHAAERDATENDRRVDEQRVLESEPGSHPLEPLGLAAHDLQDSRQRGGADAAEPSTSLGVDAHDPVALR